MSCEGGGGERGRGGNQRHAELTGQKCSCLSLGIVVKGRGLAGAPKTDREIL